jgi:hypothetical protein
MHQDPLVLDISLDTHFLRLVAIAAAGGVLFGLWLLVLLRSESALAMAGCMLLFIALMGLFATAYAYLEKLVPGLTTTDVGLVTILAMFFCLGAYFFGTLFSIPRR